MNIVSKIILKNFATATRFMVAVLRQKIVWILLDNSNFTPAKHIISRNCKSVRLIVIQKIGVLLATIRAFNCSQNWKYQAYK